jgi:adenylate cyclase
LEQEGQYFGSALNVASRVASHARAGQILCTDTVMDLITEKDKIIYRELGNVNFKNLAASISIFEIEPAHHNIEAKITDPVCRMLVKPDTASGRLHFNGQNYFFCSFECAKSFANHPANYLKSNIT